SSDLTNDNIVAFWTPAERLPGKQAHEFNYLVRFGNADLADNPMARAVDSFLGDGTRIGGGDAEGAVRVIVDFAGGPLDERGADAPVTARVTAIEEGEVLENFVEYLGELDRSRLVILAW